VALGGEDGRFDARSVGCESDVLSPDFTKDTARNTDDVAFSPVSVRYNPALDRAVLTFARPLHSLVDPSTSQPVGYGRSRLRVGTNEVGAAAAARDNADRERGTRLCHG
jgi:hypothetical protein